MTNPYPLPRETRETAIFAGDGRATYGPFSFRIWDVADVVATVSRQEGPWLTEATEAAKVSTKTFDAFTATFSPPLMPGDRAVIRSRRLHERRTDVTRGGALAGNALELELSSQGTVLQELRRDVDAMRLSFDLPPPIPGVKIGTPAMFGAIGDGVADDTLALRALLGSSYRVVDWGGPEKIYRVTDMLTVAQPSVSWRGSATIRLDRTGKRICPLLNVARTAIGFHCVSTLTFDHNAEGIPAPNLANQTAFALGCCIILQASKFDFSCRVRNSWDNGVGVIRATWTGNGEAVPYNLIQEPAFPQSWRIGHVDGENCGIGQHGGQFGEFGRKGGVVNILTASDGNVGSVTGRGNYNGFIVDFAGGGEVNAGLVSLTGTKRDPDYPDNGSGIDCYLGSGPLSIASLKSDNAARMGLAISPDAGPITIHAAIHAAGEQGAVISGGRVSGSIRATACSLLAPGSFDAVEVAAFERDVSLLLDVLSDGPTSHRRAYFSQEGNGHKVSGLVTLNPGRFMTAAYSHGTGETLAVATGAGGAMEMQGRLGINTSALPGIVDQTLLDGMTIVSPFGFHGWNLYFDAGWKFAGNGWGLAIRSDGDGKITFYTSTAANAAGAGAAASIKAMASFSSGGVSLFDLMEFADNATAAAAGVPVSGVYRDASGFLRVRI